MSDKLNLKDLPLEELAKSFSKEELDHLRNGLKNCDEIKKFVDMDYVLKSYLSMTFSLIGWVYAWVDILKITPHSMFYLNLSLSSVILFGFVYLKNKKQIEMFYNFLQLKEEIDVEKLLEHISKNVEQQSAANETLK